MSLAETSLKQLGFAIPPMSKPMASYVPWVRAGNLVYVSGQGPMRDGKPTHVGYVGRDFTVEQGQEAARVTCLNVLAAVKDAVGDLDRVVRIVKVTGFVRSAPGFVDQPKVINGASDLLVQVFGEKGRHARAAVGVNELPIGIAVEIEAVVEVA
ncbi:MAG TPA: RidA family protein [Candidatus Thermoplasmatota archaeon]|nr:RidA family protein [Candidatus Thermoplasmatota archaeon]